MTASIRQFRLASAGLCTVVYLLILAVLTISSRHDHFWQVLLGTPRMRTGFIAYSAAFLIPSSAFVILAGWRPTANQARAFRVALLLMMFFTIVAAAILLYAFCESWDWKMSI
jgi:hypothetical protein